MHNQALEAAGVAAVASKHSSDAEMKLKRRKEDGHERTFSRSGSNDWQDVELEDGDEVWFPIVVF